MGLQIQVLIFQQSLTWLLCKKLPERTTLNVFMKDSIEPAHEILVLITLSSNKGSGEPTQMDSFSKAFVARIHKVWMLMKTQAKV